MTKVYVYADGGSRGNPGKAGYGAVVLDASSGNVLAERCEYIGNATNNVAEYRGLIAGLQAAQEVAPGAQIVARLDSKLVVEQMTGRWKIKHPAMAELAQEAKKLAATATVIYEWVPRGDNAHADRLANQAMDGEGAADLTASSAAPPADGTESSNAPGARVPSAAEPAGDAEKLPSASPLAGCAGEFSPTDAWEFLKQQPEAYLVDVRTQAEWTFVGVPLAPQTDGQVVFVEWVRFPSGRLNADFWEQLSNAVTSNEQPLLFICRSGARSAAAATAATERGYRHAYNVQQGFEGDLSGDGHRNINGWRHAGLSWQQR